ncbi:MAG: RND family transporter [Acidobacteriota bacterium]
MAILLERRRRIVLAGFTLATALISSGLYFGPPVPTRDLFELPGDPVFSADLRAKKFLPSAEHSVFFLVGGKDEDHRGNVLDLEVLKELVRRRDRLMADERITAFFDEKANPLVGHPTTGPWSVAETVRDVMDGNSPALPWPGPDFDHSTQQQLNALLSVLFNLSYSVSPGEPFFPFRNLLALDLAPDSTGKWHATGMVMPIGANTNRLQAAVEAGELSGFEQWELWVDSYYRPPFPSEISEDVRIWSYAGIDTQIDQQVNATLPLVGVAFVLMNLLVALFFRNWRDLLVVSVSLVLLVLWLSGAQAWLGYPSTQLSSMLPILMLALGVDFAIHSLHRHKLIGEAHPLWSTDPRHAGLASAWPTVKGFFPALGLATITTIIAFGSALFSPIPDLEEWGVLAVFAIVSSYLLLGVFAVYLRSGFSSPSKGRGVSAAHSLRTLSGSIAGFYERRGWLILFLFLMISAWMLTAGRPDADFDVQDYVDSGSRFVRSLRMEQKIFPASGEPSYMLIEGDQLATPDIMARIQELIDALPGIGAALNAALSEPTIIDLLHLQKALLAQDSGLGTAYEDGDNNGLPDSASNLLAVLKDIRENGTRDHPDPRNARRLISSADVAELYQVENGRLMRVRVWFNVTRPEDWAMMGRLLEELKDISADLDRLPRVHVYITGLSYTRYAYVNDLTSSFTSSTLTAILLCALVVFLAFRDFRLGTLTVVPVLIVAVWLQGIMALTDTSLNIVTVQVISLAIGLGIDYPIHLTQRLREARKEHPGGARLAWVGQTMEETGVALFGSALTTLAGFLILLLSPMPLFVMFGTIMSIMIGLALLCGLVLLPTLLLKLGGLPRDTDN